MTTVFVVLCDQQYFDKARRTIIDIRTVGRWQKDLVLITVDFQPPQEFLDNFNIIQYNVSHINIQGLLNQHSTHPIKRMNDERHTKKLCQWNKLYVFDHWFEKWDRVVYLDAGMRVCDTVQHLLSIPWENCISSPDDSQPGDNKNRFGCQLDLEANPEVTKKLLAEFGDILDRKYFINCIWIYDTKILKICDKDTLEKGMNQYPISLTNEMGIMNLYFTFKYDLWRPFPEKTKRGKYLYGWSELNYSERPTWGQFCFLKYPVTLGINQTPIIKKTMGVAVPCYKKHVPVLGKLLESIQGQTVRPNVVVVSCSSVKPDEIFYKPGDYSFDLVIITAEESRNTAQNRNIATEFLLKLGVDLVSFFDADDIMHPQRIEAVIEAFLTYDCDLVLHDFIHAKTSSQTELKKYPHFNLQHGVLKKAWTGCAIVQGHLEAGIHHAQVSVTKKWAEKIKFRETREFETKEDAIFCGDVLGLTHDAVYIANKLSMYFQDGSKYS